MHILTLAWGIVSILFLGVAMIPCLGWLNWFSIPFASVGVVFGVLSLKKSTENDKTVSIVGLSLCSIVVLFGALRLFVGGGIL